ncbi:MAG: pilus assembly protein PilM [Desulfobacterales bacterium]|nr:MAG: pilus assembly protein PilM [Desulfobacterales bacterium]
MSRKVLGIDIRQHAVAAVLVKTGMREKQVEDHVYIPIPEGVEDVEQGIAAALKSMVEQMNLDGCDFVVSLPAEQFSFRNLQIPFKDSKKVRMVLPFELEPTLPFQVEDMVIDFHRTDSPEAADQTRLMAAVVDKSRLNSILEMLASFKIDPEIVTLSGLSAALCLAQQADAVEDHLFIEVDKAHSTLFAAAGGQIRLIRSFPVPETNALKSRALGAHIRRTWAALEDMSPREFQPLQVVVTGCGLDGQSFEDDLAQTLDLPVKPANLAERLKVLIGAQAADGWDPVRMDNALALALVEIDGLDALNFHKRHFAARKFLAKHRQNLVKTGILAAVVLLLAGFNFMMESYTLEKKLSRLNEQITAVFRTTFPEVQTIVDPYQEMKVKIQEVQKNEGFPADIGSRIRCVDILNGLSQTIPEEVVIDINRLVIAPDSVVITGTTDSFNSVDDIKGRLEKIDFFKKVTTTSANKERSGDQVRFMLKVDL